MVEVPNEKDFKALTAFRWSKCFSALTITKLHLNGEAHLVSVQLCEVLEIIGIGSVSETI